MITCGVAEDANASLAGKLGINRSDARIILSIGLTPPWHDIVKSLLRAGYTNTRMLASVHEK